MMNQSYYQLVGDRPIQVGSHYHFFETNDALRFDRAHFFRFGPSSLDFEAVYFILSADYLPYMDIQQRINLGLMRELAALGVGFAYPTRTLRVETPLRIAPDAPASA